MLRFVFASLIVILLGSSEYVFAASNCNLFMSKMDAGELYEADGGCSPSDCLLHKVTPNVDISTGRTDVSLNSNRSYDFYYKTEETPVVTSLVAIQFKFLGLDQRPKNSKPVGVNLERDATPFVCWPSDARGYKYIEYVDSSLVDGAIDYDTYDRFHRLGRLSSPEDTILHEKFHIYYQTGNNRRCVRSDDDYRAPLFLMHGRDALPNSLEKAAFRVGLPAAAEKFNIGALAHTATETKALKERSDVAPFSQLKVLLTNYQKKELSSGCFGFSASTNLADRAKTRRG